MVLNTACETSPAAVHVQVVAVRVVLPAELRLAEVVLGQGDDALDRHAVPPDDPQGQQGELGVRVVPVVRRGRVFVPVGRDYAPRLQRGLPSIREARGRLQLREQLRHPAVVERRAAVTPGPVGRVLAGGEAQREVLG
jgi:hypothetical protein